jgi:hypothetical protein
MNILGSVVRSAANNGKSGFWEVSLKPDLRL